MVKIAIVDYGIGNLRSIKTSLEAVGSEIIITNERDGIVNADAIVLPGVGAFEGALKNLEKISDIILNQVEESKPLLGICLGLQLLFTASMEGGFHKGLDIFNGKVIKIPLEVKIPHMGWNTLRILKPDNPLVREVPNESYVYFVHSYYGAAECADDVISRTYYGLDFPSALSTKNVFATQFHPEKSGETGLHILKNFVGFVKS
jgi:glutamine amidotransferase